MARYLEFLTVIALIYRCIMFTREYILYVRTYKRIKYTEKSFQNANDWRWRIPCHDLGILHGHDTRFILKDTEHISSLILSRRTNDVELLANLLGYFLIGLGSFILIRDIIWGASELQGFWFVKLLMLGTGFLFLNIGDQPTQINLYSDRLEIVTKYALFLYRNNHFRPHKRLKIKGRRQSMLETDAGRGEPDYKVTILKPVFGVFEKKRVYLLACNQTQGSWIVGGLKQWNTLASSPRT